jgi:hypothetical protein
MVKSKNKPAWLDRRIARPGPFLSLCLSESDFRATIAPLKPPQIPQWMNHGAHATTHFLTNEDGNTCAVVCMGSTEGRSPIEIAGLLVHEAVHVWQAYCDDIGERNPGAEQEAYGVQSIAQELLAEYARRRL